MTSNDPTCVVYIDYQAGSEACGFSEEEYARVRDWFRNEVPDFEFDAEWIAHLRQSNGGVPLLQNIETSEGKVKMIKEMLFFGDIDVAGSLSSVECLYDQAGNSEAFDLLLIPIATLAFGDLLCLDHRDRQSGLAPVVVWLHEESQEDEPATDFVAGSFREFVNLLH